MLDVVTPYQHETATAIHSRRIDYGKPRHPSALRGGSEAITGESANQPGGEPDQAEDDHERKDEGQSSRHTQSLPNTRVSQAGFSDPATVLRGAPWRLKARASNELLTPSGRNCRPTH